MSNNFLIGGDEVNTYCWQHNSQILQWLQKQGLSSSAQDLHKVWAQFEVNLTQIVKKNLGSQAQNGTVFLWSSTMTSQPEYR